MSKAYIPKDTWVVCTYQLNTDPKKLDVTRAKVSVFYKKDKALLTVEDKNTDKKFICKSPMNIVMGIGGLFIGLVLASNPVGWVIAGAIAVVVVAAAVTIITHSCTSHLQKGKWINFKETVYFNGHRAITQSSMLMCDSGGMLQPIISYDVACKAAKAIAWENIKETTVVTAGAIASGFLMGKGGGFLNAMKGIFTKLGALFTLGGIGTTYAMTSYQQYIMRGNEAYADNEIYQRMNNADTKDYSDIKTIGEETGKSLKDAALSGAPPNVKDLAGVVQLYRTGQLIIQDAALQAQFEKLATMNRQQLNTSELAKNIWREVQANPKYENVYNAVKRNSNYNQNRVTPAMRNNAISHLDDSVNNNKWSLNNPNSLLSKGASIALFFVPLISGYFSENARRKLADIAVQDATDSISVRTSK
ncbi:PAAR-like protein [Apibacter sp. HY039]|uniref:PAAR-like protein n=1 Tax=Apibacter sp. HY039 TaxID=2501476 RepID=UPI000FEB8CF4|nr:PAAR-like protein [Apibacter sp. HY039]